VGERNNGYPYCHDEPACNFSRWSSILLNIVSGTLLMILFRLELCSHSVEPFSAWPGLMIDAQGYIVISYIYSCNGFSWRIHYACAPRPLGWWPGSARFLELSTFIPHDGRVETVKAWGHGLRSLNELCLILMPGIMIFHVILKLYGLLWLLHVIWWCN